MHLTSTEWIWFTAAVSVLGTVTAGLLWTWFTRRAHRGEHSRHDPNNAPAAVIAQVAQSSRVMEPFHDFQARLNANQLRRNDPRFGGRHAAPEPGLACKPTGKATAA
jgi:hypothetical protein